MTKRTRFSEQRLGVFADEFFGMVQLQAKIG